MLQLELIADFVRALFAPITNFLGTLPLTDTMVMSLPPITLVVFGILALVVGMKYNPLGVSFLGLLVTLIEMVALDPLVQAIDPSNMQFVRDPMADFFIYIILMVGFLVLMSATLYGKDPTTSSC
jgi:hypothetical protein